MKITILGKVPKGDAVRETWFDWKREYIDKIREILPNASALHGDHIKDDAGSELVVGHDIWTVKHADVVVVDAREKIGAGTAQEMIMAKYYKRPLVTVIPTDTHHRKSNITFNGVVIKDWVHPFLEVTSDYVATDIEDAVFWIKRYCESGAGIPIKGIDVIEAAVAHFESELPDIVSKYRSQGW